MWGGEQTPTQYVAVSLRPMWKVFQFLIVAAVTLSNVRWGWTDNGLVVGGTGIAAAFVATYCLVWVLDLMRRLKAGIARRR